jgi:pyruvate formate lyase activating enzyme
MEQTTRPGTRTVEDPAPQAPFSLKAAGLAREKAGGSILRICWETNGSMHPAVLDKMVEVALGSGGNIKFDLKAWDENLHLALTGASNRRTLENFARAGTRVRERPVPPLLLASTLLVPGCIEAEEVRHLARFIASIDRDIPYSLLAFHPHFRMADLPLITRVLAGQCLEAARAVGLRRVRLGNVRLLA